MIIRHIGHAEFYMETESGFRIVTDPYDAACGYPLHEIAADTVLVSHGHHDHNAVETLGGHPRIIDHAGVYTPEAGIRITALRGYHDDALGKKRGETLLFLIEAESLRIVHLGDLGCMPDEEQLRILARPDILMIPVGGFYTIDGKAARRISDLLNAQTVLPMHYKTKFNPDWPISGPELFLEGIDDKAILRDAAILRVTAGDIECQPKAVLFRQS